MKENSLALETTPLVICGDFNSKPNSSIYYLFNDKPYDISKGGRSHETSGVKAYRKQEGRDIFQLVNSDIQQHRSELEPILGKIKSSYSHFNSSEPQPESEEKCDVCYGQQEMNKHPEHSMFCH